MDKVRLNAFVNIILILLILILGFSGIVMGHFLPEKQDLQVGGGLDESLFLRMTRDGWAEIHDNLGEIVLFFIIVHLVLHLYYIRNLPRLIKRR